MATLRRFLYVAAIVWIACGLAIAIVPHFWLVTVFDQLHHPDYGYVQIAGVEAIALGLLMIMVAHHAEQNWWWSWAFVIATAATALVAALEAIVGVPEGESAGLWWLIAGVNAALALGLVWGLARAGTERPPV